MWSEHIPANALQRWLARAQERHAPPSVRSATKGKDGQWNSRSSPVRIKFVHQCASKPPTFALYLNRYEPRNVLPANYLQYLRKELRREFGLWGAPIRFTVHGKYKTGQLPVTLTKQ